MVKSIFQLVAIIAAALVIAFLFQDYVGQGNRVKGESMYPTLNNNDYLITQKVEKNYEKGDIVIIDVNDHSIVKRIVALGGEVVEIKDGKLYVNDKLVEEDYTNGPANEDFPRTKVAKGTVFVLGDNRNNSTDSRYYKAFKLEDINGKVWMRLGGGFKKFN